jgi:PPOX class probable F420-dependent enzyme
MIDESDPFGRRVAEHLRSDPVVWLTTVAPSGAPQPSPVWFLWDGASSLLMFSRAGTSRTRNLATNPRVALNFAGDGRGGDIVVLSGTASVELERPGDEVVQAYLEKYTELMQRLGYEWESFATQYNVPIRITLTRLRGH